MEKFAYVNATSAEQVPSLLNDEWGETMIIAGGTDLLGELKEYIETPEKVVNLKTIPGLDEVRSDGSGLTIGALATITEIAAHPTIQEHYTALAEAAASVASPQIRNAGTLGGNLCQRPRCWYYRDPEVICLKKGGDRCYAVDGLNKYHAILGGGPVYIAGGNLQNLVETNPDSHYWCNCTMMVVGPDDRFVSPDDCKAARSCFEPIGGTPVV